MRRCGHAWFDDGGDAGVRFIGAGNYTFAVSARAVTNGIAFHVSVTSKSEPILPDCGLSVCVWTETTHSVSTAPAQPGIPVALHKGAQVWEADFVAPRELPPDLVVIFSTLAHVTMNGKLEAMPSVTFYVMRVKEFVKS
jgi:hypothetical protein